MIHGLRYAGFSFASAVNTYVSFSFNGDSSLHFTGEPFKSNDYGRDEADSDVQFGVHQPAGMKIDLFKEN